MGKISIFEAEKSDFDYIYPLLEQLWPDKKLDKNKLTKVFNKGLKSDNQVYLIAKFDEDIVGFGSLTIKNNLWQAGNLANIDELVVDYNYRGRNIGTLLME